MAIRKQPNRRQSERRILRKVQNIRKQLFMDAFAKIPPGTTGLFGGAIYKRFGKEKIIKIGKYKT